MNTHLEDTTAMIPSDEPTCLTESVEFARNPEPRCPCVLLLDTSGSMGGQPIKELEAGLATFKNEVMENSLAARRLEIAIVTFNSEIDVVQSFVTANNFTVPELVPTGLTRMSDAIRTGLKLIDDRKAVYKRQRAPYYRPWCILITDGEPAGEEPGDFESASAELQTAIDGKKLTYYAVGVDNANMEKLKALSGRRPAKLKGLNFTALFEWLSASVSTVSTSNLGGDEPVKLDPIDTWGEVYAG